MTPDASILPLLTWGDSHFPPLHWTGEREGTGGEEVLVTAHAQHPGGLRKEEEELEGNWNGVCVWGKVSCGAGMVYVHGNDFRVNWNGVCVCTGSGVRGN